MNVNICPQGYKLEGKKIHDVHTREFFSDMTRLHIYMPYVQIISGMNKTKNGLWNELL